MTTEEAGQIILEGRRHVTCEPCFKRREEGRNMLISDCELCRGWLEVPNPEYVEACSVLGVKEPLPRDEEEELRLNEYMKSKPEFYGEQLKIMGKR